MNLHFFTNKKDTPVRLEKIEEYLIDTHSVFYGALSMAAILLFIFVNLGGL